MAAVTATTKSILEAVPSLLKLPVREYHVDYDREADVLYISLQWPQKATDTREEGDGILVRYRGKEVVGVTVLNASRRKRRGS